jgi:hypothetical protein
LTDARPIRNEWLYSLSQDEEVLTIPYNYLEAGGDLLLPGDMIRVRVSYENDEIPAPSRTRYDNESEYSGEAYGNPNQAQSSYQPARRVIKTDILFDAIAVKDMINSNGQSVYEVYKEVMRLDEKQRQEVMKSKAFQANIKPKSLLLAAAPEDMELYASYKANMRNGSFLITILSRANHSIDFDQLPTLETEVRTWIEGG